MRCHLRLPLRLALILMALPAHAADFEYSRTEGVAFITLSGELKKGDARSFEQIASEATDGATIVALSSPGGLMAEGLDIGAYIHDHHFTTVVLKNQDCVSACSFAWLAGARRLIQPGGRVGFHASYRIDDDGSSHESGSGNAIVGAFLNELGYPISAISYITSAPPNGVFWLNKDDADRVGISYETVDDSPAVAAQTETPPPASPPSVALAQPAPVRPALADWQVLVANYYDTWSGQGADAYPLTKFYASNVTFYGTNTPRSDVMEEKQKFSTRWPIRKYAVDSASLVGNCSQESCSIWGTVHWDVSSPERNARSVGAATFALVATRVADGSLLITSEDGKVLFANHDVMNASVAQDSALRTVPDATATAQGAPSLSFQQGKADRTGYESWVSALAEGPYLDGVKFWAANRSERDPPSCMPSASLVYLAPDAVAAFQSGCEAARERLAISDMRRHADADYKAGWNSL